jgi:alanyl-tRNA synthetase
VAAGIRRIEAVTGQVALEAVQATVRNLQTSAQLLKEKPEALGQRIERLLSEMKGLEREIEQLKGRLSAASAADAGADVQTIDGINVLVKRVEADSPAALRELLDRFKDRIRSGVVVLGSVSDAKVLLIAGVTPDLTKRFHAGQLIKKVSALVGGSGGGRPDMAQAGGTQPEKLDEALARASEMIRQG